MDIRQLESLCKVAELGSFSLAAEALFLTQPTVSAHIQALERALGTRLFDRMGRRVVLTPAGEVIYRYARRILSLREEALKALRGMDNLKGELDIAASTIPGEYFLPRMIASFTRGRTSLKVKLIVTDSQGVMGLISKGLAEIGVVGMKGGEERLAFQPLLRDRVIMVVSSSHPLAGRQIEWEELVKAPMVTREYGSGTRRTFERALRQAGFNPSRLRIVAEFGSSSAVKEVVKAGLGVGIISDMAVKDSLGGEISEVKLQGLGEVSRTFYLVLRKGKTLSPVAERFVEFVRSGGRWTQD